MFNLQEIRTRLMWLSLGLALSLLIAGVINSFEATLEKNLILAAFIPLIVYMSDAVGTQMEAIIIRELNKRGKFKFRKFVTRQVFIVVPVAIVIGVVAALFLYLWQHNATLSFVIGFSLICGMLTSLFTGAVMPYWFWKMHKDPAEASGPIATVLQDFISVVVFFYIAQAFFR